MLKGLPGLRPASIAPLTRLIASVGTGLTTHGGKFGLVLPIRRAILPAKPSQSSHKRAGRLAEVPI
jgi:hypothetical protein